MITKGPYKNMEHPCMLYKKPGPHKMMDGMYDYIVVDKCDEKAYDAALKDGWKTILQIQGVESKQPVEEGTQQDDPYCGKKETGRRFLMSWTKRQFVTAAFEEIGLASYVFDLQPGQLESAVRRLDAMMATWNAQGLRLGYPIPSGAIDGGLDEDTHVPDSANEAILTNLGIRLASSFGKTVSPDVKIAASSALKILQARLVSPVEMQLPGSLPAGAGHKGGTLAPPVDDIEVGPGGNLDFE